jgi:tRNA-dihydrouridine synthase A
VFVVHARKAILKGLSPKENREVPPLKYDVVSALRSEFPKLTFVLNGGIRTLEEVQTHLETFDGVMIGREAYSNPYLLAQIEQAVFNPDWNLPVREQVIEEYAHYVRSRLAEGHRLRSMVKHVQGLYAGLPRVRSWRRYLSEGAGNPTAGADLLLDALRIVQAA